MHLIFFEQLIERIETKQINCNKIRITFDSLMNIMSTLYTLFTVKTVVQQYIFMSVSH